MLFAASCKLDTAIMLFIRDKETEGHTSQGFDHICHSDHTKSQAPLLQ